MKFSLLLMLAALMIGPLTGYGQKISLDLKNVSLETVIKELKKKTDYLFFYKEEEIRKTGKISVHAQQEDIEAVLERVLHTVHFTLNKVDKTFILMPRKEEAPSSNARMLVKGIVRDENGQPLSGVSVTVKGGQAGTATNEKGEFAFNNIDGHVVLVFSYTGYATHELGLNGRPVVSVTLTKSNAMLSDVIVTALGIEKSKRSLTSSVVSLDGASLTAARETNLAYSFAGKMAGVSVGNVSGGPGSSSNIIIRGVNSLKGSPPLYVIDGVPIDNTQRGIAGQQGGADLGDGIGNINPDDIENITVLKGASAAALYGSRASGGVIVITTKSGKGQKGIGVTINSNVMAEKAVDLTDYQYEYGHGINGKKPATQAEALGTIWSWGAKLDGADVIQFDGVSRPYVAQKNNFKNFYRTGITYTNTISITSSGEKGHIRFSASSLDNNAIIPSTGLGRTSLLLNAQVNIIPKLTLHVMGNYIHEGADRSGASLNASALNANFSMLFLPTSLDVNTLKPGYNPVTGAETLPWTGNTFFSNPWFIANRMKLDTKRNRFIGITSLNYEILDWLQAQARVGYDRSDDRATQIEPTGTGFRPGGYLFEAFLNYKELNADFLLTANKKISRSLQVNGNVGANLRLNESERLASEGSTFSIPFLYTLSNTTTGKNSYYNLKRTEVQSLYFNAEASFKSILFVNITGRRDWFSVLDGRSIFYPSAGAGFIFSDMLKWPALSYGKLRSSWARTTSDPTSLAYQTSLYYNFSGTASGIPLGQISNEAIPNLRLGPNTITESEAGIELKWLQNRIGLEVAYYNRQIKDEPINVTTSVTSGYSAATLNAGTLENKGVEILLTGAPVKTARFNWNVSINYTKNNNKVKSLAGSLQQITVAQSNPGQSFISHVVGYAANQVMAFDYKRDAKGNILYDAAGLPVQGALVPLGSGIHPEFGGINNEFRFKNLSFSFLVDFKWGGKIYSGTDYFALRYGLAKRSLQGRETGVTGTGITESTGNPNTVVVLPYTYYDQLAKRISSELVYDASFAKLRQIIIGYEILFKAVKKISAKSASLSLVARNVAILKRHTKNVDPEGNYSPTLAGQGIVQAGLPFTRSFGVNLNIKF